MTEVPLYGYNIGAAIKRVTDGHDVWVKFVNPKETRCGSILRWKRPNFSQRELTKIKNIYGRESPYYNGYDEMPFYGETYKFEFVGLPYKDIEITRWSKNLEKMVWLKNYAGPAVRMQTPVEKPEIPLHKDQFGITAKAGDFIAFVRGGSNLEFGTITRFSPGGWIYYRTVDGSESYFVGYSNFAIIDKEFRTRMMIRKLGL